MAKGYSYKDAMEAALEAGMMGVPGGMAAGAARGIRGAARGMADAVGAGSMGTEKPSMMERAMKEAEDTARMYGKSYKEGLGMKKGGKVSSASARADGCAVRGKTKGRMI